MSDKKVYEVISAFAGAKSWGDYYAAKKLCAKSFGPTGQLAFVDAAREAKHRLEAIAQAGCIVVGGAR